MKKKLFAILLCFTMFVGALPTTSLAAGIKSGQPALTVNQSKVAFAGYEWWVIGDGTSGVYPQAGHITLLSANTDFPEIPFRSGQKNKGEGYSKKYSQNSWEYYYADNPDGSQWKTPNEYAGSTLQQKMVSIANGIPGKEQAIISARSLTRGGTYNKPSIDGIAGQGVGNQKLWALSEAEWNIINNTTVNTYGRYGSWWWLRSPNPKCGYESKENMSVGVLTNCVVHYDEAVRPALSLNLSSVLFTSAATGGKSTATTGGNLVAAESPAETVKFTMKSGRQKLNVEATTSQSTQTGETLSFSYSGATTGNNQYISCVLTDGSGAVKYYGKLADSSGAAKGNLSVPLAGVADGAYTLKIFSEEANGDFYTDFCSEPVTMKVDVLNGSGTVSRFGGKLLPTQNLKLYVNGEQFTSEKLSIACGEGTATYDPDTKTLTLNNATITNGGKSDENPKYGIRVVGDNDLTIKLSGTNSITLANGGGIFADGGSDNYNIIGDGKLTIDVKWDALYTLNGNISISEGAKLDIKSAEGNGIMSYNKGNIFIDGAKVKSFAYYSAANAKELEVKNDSEVVLNSSADYFNAAYMGDENGVGKIEIINSKVEATSHYPALYTEGKLTVNGGEVKCTSTADAAIWTRGDILIKGGAKVTTDGKYPMGGYGTFTVEEAEVDAKNTNENNIPAIFDECVPVIANGYQLTYAKAVDSEGTGIDLLSSGTQYFALYKNVHFITKTAYPVSFVVPPNELINVVVKVNGQAVTNPVNLPAGTYQIEVTADNCKAYSGNITVTADTATHTQTIAMTYLPADYTKVDAAIAKANALNKDEYKDFTAVENAVNAVVRSKNITEQSEVDAMAKAIEDAIAALVYKDADYTKVDATIAKADALNKDDYKDFTAVENAVKAVVRGKDITEQSEVDAMAKAIEDALAALQYKDADYTKVDAAIAKANALNEDDYKDFTAVENAVKAVVRDKNITEQSEVDAMAKAIEDAIAGLQYKDADYTKVDATIAKANALNKDDYKDFSAVENAVKAVVRGKNITEQSEVDKMAKAIEDAIAALEYKDADYTKVDAAIAKANALNKDEYKDFSAVEAAVKAVVRGKNITEQSEVDKMAKAIEDAIAALEKKPDNTKPGTSYKSPQTGYNLALWIALLFIGGGAAIGTTVVSRKKKYDR